MMKNLILIIVNFIITIISTYILILTFKNTKITNIERTKGIVVHTDKSNIPIMGGISFIISLVTSIFIFDLINILNLKIIILIIMIILFGLLGLCDDLLKSLKKNIKGLTPKYKLIFQCIISCLFIFCSVKFLNKSPIISIYNYDINLYLSIFINIFIIVGTINSANFTDGVDGLLTIVTIIISIFFAIISYMKDISILPFIISVIAMLLGFLIFNFHPAKIFMGDTGSFILGAYVAGVSYILNLSLLLPIIGFIYMIEMLSVIIQVIYFKRTNGKRFFKMTPLHHHFELCGWSEKKIVFVFSCITAILTFILLLFII